MPLMGSEAFGTGFRTPCCLATQLRNTNESLRKSANGTINAVAASILAPLSASSTKMHRKRESRGWRYRCAGLCLSLDQDPAQRVPISSRLQVARNNNSGPHEQASRRDALRWSVGIF